MTSVYLPWREIRSFLPQIILEVGGVLEVGETTAPLSTLRHQRYMLCWYLLFKIWSATWSVHECHVISACYEHDVPNQTKFEAKQINRVPSLNARNTFNKYYTDFETCKFLISNNSLAIKCIISFLIIVFQYWEFIIHYFLDVSYIPSCMSGSRNFKMAKLEEPRHCGQTSSPHGCGKKKWIFLWVIFYKCISRLICSLFCLWWEMNYTF